MFLEYFFLCVFLVVVIWWLPRVGFIKKAGLTISETRLLLCFKLMIGLGCALYFHRFLPLSDYVQYNHEGLIEYQLLLSDPVLFFTDITHDLKTYGAGGLFASENSFWGYLRFNLLIKFIALLNLLTHGNFYFNTVVFSSLVFWGNIAFYRVFNEIYKPYKWLLLIACFGIPSLLMYTSCIHKDGIVFLCLSLISYCFYRMLAPKYLINLRHLLTLILGLTVIFLLRNYVIVALLPSMAIGVLCKIFPTKKLVVVIGCYSLFLLLFIFSSFTRSSLNLPAAVVQRKADFATLQGGQTTIPMNDLSPGIANFARNFPQAINHSLLRPFLWEFSEPDILLAALELFSYQLLIIIFVVFHKRGDRTVHVFNIFGLILFFNMMLIIGYTIPNVGAIVRYRSIFWILLLTPLICNIEWTSVSRIFRSR